MKKAVKKNNDRLFSILLSSMGHIILLVTFLSWGASNLNVADILLKTGESVVEVSVISEDVGASTEELVSEIVPKEEVPILQPKIQRKTPATRSASNYQMSIGQGEPGSSASENSGVIGVQAVGLTKPRYPRESRLNGEEGRVILSVEVTEEGKSDKVAIIKSSGFERLDRSAIEAVSEATFKPATKDGERVRASTKISFMFRLDEK